MGDIRKWISYSLNWKSFSYSGGTKHFYRIKEHEMSKTHINNL
jgi:hypothetical protein